MSQQLQELLTGRMNGTLTAEQEEELRQLIQEPGQRPALEAAIDLMLYDADVAEVSMDADRAAVILQSVVPAPVIPMRARPSLYRRVAVAVSVALLIGLGTYLIFFTGNRSARDRSRNELVNTNIAAPSRSKAMLTLADGRKLLLDSLTGNPLALENNVQLVKAENGALSYQSLTKNDGSQLFYNTLENPKGSSVIDLVLNDGSHVWLNAGSSLKYPVAFAGKNRQVSITGEAYFEIKHDETHPFIVEKGDARVQVLGTHFNVNAYEDEASIKVSLLQGSVAVSLPHAKSLIKPGQQAVLTNNIDIKSDVDMDAVMAWRNGKFVFENGADIKVIMRQIERWYDVEVSYQGNVYPRIGGSISKKENLAQVLKMLELTGMVHFSVDGSRITVKP